MAATLMILSGMLTFFVGITGVIRGIFFNTVTNYPFYFSVRSRGITFVVIGAVAFAVGLALLFRMHWARHVATVVAVVSAVANFMFLPFYPLWSIAVLTLDIIIIWELTRDREGREFTRLPCPARVPGHDATGGVTFRNGWDPAENSLKPCWKVSTGLVCCQLSQSTRRETDVRRNTLRRLPYALVTILVLPIVAEEYFSRDAGREYGIGLLTKLRILFIMIRNNVRVVSASNFLYHIIMAGKILRIPKDVQGDLVECGCYKGGSAVNLSHLAALCGRRLHLFDSFEGLPSPKPEDQEHLVLSEQRFHTYEGGGYAGSLAEVRENIRTYGVLDVCEFHPGFFSDTLPGFSEQLVFAYVDADFTDSVRDCLRYLWPLLQNGSFLFTDEAHHTRIAGLFYDTAWWAEEFNTEPPGLVGGGNGLGLLLHPGGFRSSLGFTAKLRQQELPRVSG